MIFIILYYFDMKKRTVLDVFKSWQIKSHEIEKVIKTIWEEFLWWAEKVWIFGSTIREERKNWSDIDIVSINKKASSYSEMRVILEKNIEIWVVKMKPDIEWNTENDKVLKNIQNSAVYCTIEEFKKDLLTLLN